MDEGLNNLAAAADYMHEMTTGDASQQEGIDRISHQLVLQRLRYDYFYSTMDQEYFKDNEFIPVVQHIGYDIRQPIRRSTLSEIRRLMAKEIGTPRRFSAAFIRKERKRLWDTRKLIRFASYDTRSSPSPPTLNPLTIHKGDAVIVYSKVNKILCRGRVMSEGPFYSESRGYLITLDNPLLRNEWCNDYDIKVVAREHADAVSLESQSSGSHMTESIHEYIDHAKTAVVNVIDLRSGDTEYSAPVLDTIVRCVALILWMKKSVNLSSAGKEDIEELSRQAMNYVTAELQDLSSDDKDAICRELQGAIRQVFSLVIENESPTNAL